MNYRISVACVASLITVAGSLGASGAAAQSSNNAANGDKVYSTTTVRDPAAETVKERFTQRFPNLPVLVVRRTPYGLFEIQTGGGFIYTDDKVTWVMEGPLIDAMTRRDVTRERQEQLSAISFDQLPLELAIKHVNGDGSRKIAIFEDPNCGYCKQLRKTLASIDNLTIYTFVYPILSADSKEKARNVWCAQDRSVAWDDWMLRGTAPVTAQCETPVDQVLALGHQLMVRGTPTLFFANGARVSGALSLEQLNNHLN